MNAQTIPFSWLGKRGAFLVLLIVLCVSLSASAQGGDPFVEDIVGTIARQVPQLPQGAYDAYSDRTFVVFPGCEGGPICTVDPYIIYYDHASQAWSDPLKIAATPAQYDAHSYPQVLIDSQHHVHVFNGGHVHPIQHYVSTVETDHADVLAPENWEERPFDNTTNQDKATYIMAFKTQDGTFYLFYRQTVQAAPDWYEPIYYVTSADDGVSWSPPAKLIDPGGKTRIDGSCQWLTADDGWDTIYVKGVRYQPQPERLHITFENHKGHNDYEDKVFYVYFDFASQRVYAPTGQDLGDCVNQYEFEHPAHHSQFYAVGERPYTNIINVVAVDAQGQVNLFYENDERANHTVIDHIVWQGSDWSSPTPLFKDELYDASPLDVAFYPDNSFDLYLEQDHVGADFIQLLKWHTNNDPFDPEWLKTSLRSNTEGVEYNYLSFVTDAHPDLRATFVEGTYTYWYEPLANGKMYAWGRQDEQRLYDIGGRVTDAAGVPQAGLALAASGGLNAATDAAGRYVFTDLDAARYTLTPTLSGYSFFPPTRSLYVPPSTTDQDFILLPGLVSLTLELDGGTANLPAHLAYTDTRRLSTRLNFGAGVVDQPTQVWLRPSWASGRENLSFARHAFELRAGPEGTLGLNFPFARPVTVTLDYSQDDLRLVTDEAGLTLRRWNGTAWQDAAVTCDPPSAYVRDPANGTLQVAICQTGHLALFGPTSRAWLPSALRRDGPHRLTHSSSQDAQPVLSPDGQTLVFVSDRHGGPDLFRLSLGGGEPINLTPTPFDAKDAPVLSPDGGTIAYASNRAGDWDIYLLDVAGGDPRPVVANPGSDEVHPAFTPDGLGLLFSSNRAGGNWDIYAATIGDPTWTRLTDDPAPDRFPSPSPDGTWVAFRSERDGNSEIYLMRADGSSLRRLTNDSAFDGYVSFTPDSSGLVFVSDTSGPRHGYQMNLAGTNRRALIEGQDWVIDDPRPSPDGRWVVYAGGPVGEPYAIRRHPFVSPLRSIGQAGADHLAEACDWEAGVLAYGWIQAWRATGEEVYRQWARDWIDRCMPLKTEIDHVNDGLFGYAALVAYQTGGGAEYLAFAQQVADYLLYTAPRTADGTLTHDEGRVWVDTLLGSVPFLLEMSQVTGEDVYQQRALDQLFKHAAHLQDPESGLYRHAWDESGQNSAGQAYWGRGNGWAMLAQVAVLSHLDPTHPSRSAVLDMLKKQAAGLAPLQDDGGLWHTVLTRPDFYLETSASCLIGYGLEQGVEAGWLGASYQTQVEAAKLGVWRQVGTDGSVGNVSASTWPMEEEQYNQQPYGALELYGQGVALLFQSP